MTAVELHVARTAFADTLGAMRDWLDRQDAGPVKFETAGREDGTIHIRVEFGRADLAQEFATRFGAAARNERPSPDPIAIAGG